MLAASFRLKASSSLLILFVGLMVSSCGNHSNEVNDFDEPPTFCSNELEILNHPIKNNVCIDIDLNLGMDALFTSIGRQGNFEMCNRYNWFVGTYPSMKYESVNVRTYSFKYCEGEPWGEDIPHFEDWGVDILINENSQYLIDGELVSPDSIGQAIFQSMLHLSVEKDLRTTLVKTFWDRKTPFQAKAKLFDAVFESYVMLTDSFARSQFSKSLCELNIEQVYNLEEPPELHFAFQELIPPPSPSGFTDILEHNDESLPIIDLIELKENHREITSGIIGSKRDGRTLCKPDTSGFFGAYYFHERGRPFLNTVGVFVPLENSENWMMNNDIEQIVFAQTNSSRIQFWNNFSVGSTRKEIQDWLNYFDYKIESDTIALTVDEYFLEAIIDSDTIREIKVFANYCW